VSIPRGMNSIKINNYLKKHIYTENSFDLSLIFILSSHKSNTVEAESFRKSTVKETEIEFHLSHLSVIWININIPHLNLLTPKNHLY